MSDIGRNDRAAQCGADVAAYALGSLDAGERRSFERHLATCAVCPDELIVFTHVIDALAAGVPGHEAPDDLRRRVLAVVHHDAGAPSATPPQGPWTAAPRRPASRLRRPALALAALMIAVAAVGGALRVASSPAPGTRVLQARVIGSVGSAQLRRSAGHAELIVDHLPPPPSGEVYEVWLNRAGQRPQPTKALFNVTGDGDGDVDVPGDLAHVDQIMVTPEPAGGTQLPTHPAVITAQLT